MNHLLVGFTNELVKLAIDDPIEDAIVNARRQMDIERNIPPLHSPPLPPPPTPRPAATLVTPGAQRARPPELRQRANRNFKLMLAASLIPIVAPAIMATVVRHNRRKLREQRQTQTIRRLQRQVKSQASPTTPTGPG